MVSTTTDLDTFYRALSAVTSSPPRSSPRWSTTVPWYPGYTGPDGYGLGLYSVAVCNQLVWGHDGAVIGYGTYSFHSADGTRQVTLGQNLIYGSDPAIDTPIGQFLTDSLCNDMHGGAPATVRHLDTYPGAAAGA